MNAFFGASVQVVALIIAVVCIVSAILGRSFAIGPVSMPAPQELLPRAALATLGMFLLTVAFWSNVFGGQTLFDMVMNRISPPENPRFTSDNGALITMLTAKQPDAETVGLHAEVVYDEAPAGKHCLVIREIYRVFPKRVDAYPYDAMADVARYHNGARTVLADCATEVAAIAALTQAVATSVTATAPVRPAAVTAGRSVVTRPTPTIAIHGDVSAETARRVLSAGTLPADEGWIFIGVRDRDHPVLIADRRIAVTDIPRSGVVATIADAELLDTVDPGQSLGTVKGYVHAGSAVEVLGISGPRHYTAGKWDGYEVYARVRIQSLPQRATAAVAQAAPALSKAAAKIAPGATPTGSPSAATAIAPCATIPTPSADTFTYCNETYPVRFGDFQFQSYKVTDSHSTGIHFRNVGPHAVYLSVFPGCGNPASCPALKGAFLPPAPSKDDAGNDYVYTAETLAPFTYGWSIQLSEPQGS